VNLYHYTDLNAVHSILDSHKIRMTDIRFLNDKTEYLQGLEILQEASHEVFLQDTHYEKEFISAIEGWFEDAFHELLELQNAIEMFYVASFSRSSDTLSQWRSYGMFAIEFDHDKLQERLLNLTMDRITGQEINLGHDLIECHYVLNKNDALEEAVKKIRSKILPILNLFWQEGKPLKKNGFFYTSLKKEISLLATTFKHASFYEEQEVRLVISDKIVSKNINFRTKNNILVPFYEFDITAEVISGIKIGPVEDQIITEQSLQIFASHRATKLGSERYRLAIETSDIPYRML